MDHDLPAGTDAQLARLGAVLPVGIGNMECPVEFRFVGIEAIVDRLGAFRRPGIALPDLGTFRIAPQCNTKNLHDPVAAH